jgi:hypothetical protein
MAVKRRQNWQGQQRVDVPHLKSVESAISHDFDQLISGLVIGENKSYVVRGLKINMPGSIGSSANGLQLLVENSAFLHGASDESGTFYTIPTGTPSEILSSTTNERVQGSFTPNTDNYVGIEFVRAVDDTTADQVYFWNPTTNIEITRTVPLAIIQDYKIVISTSSFGSNVLPIAVVQTDASNNVISITDRRPLLYRLGTAGESEPNPFYNYGWDETRSETFYTSTSSTSDPFFGGDKVIGDMKQFFDALMTELKLLKGTPFWYSASDAGSLYRNRQDLGATAFTGRGNISHAIAFFNGQVAGMTSDVSLKAISLAVTLTADGVKDIDTLISEHNIANESEPVYLISGDGSQVPTEDIVLTSAPGRINWDSEVYLNFIGGRLRYRIDANEDSDHITLTDNQVAYVKLVRGENIIPNLVFTNSGTIVTSVGNVNWTEDLQPGDFVKDASKGDEFYYEIASVDSLSQVTLTEAFNEPSSGPGGFDAQYAFGVYETSPAPSTERHMFIADRGSVPFNEDVFWLFFRADNGGSPQVYVRMLGGKELEQGEQREISDNTSQAILNYIGASSEADNAPNYTDATGTSITNIHLTDSENLTLGMKRLEHRDDVIPRVRAIDIISSALPTGVSATIDGEALVNNDYVFFVNPAIEGLYKVSGVGTAIAFEKMHTFKGETDPVNGDLIRVESGTSYFQTVWKRVANEWKPLEVKEATKEPTGFPNRVDSEISFDNLTRTFSVGPKAPATHFDIFVKGKPYRFTTPQSIVVPDDEGIFFFYFETDGTLVYDTSFDLTLITEKVFTSTVYWDVTNQQAILIGDERHGITMDAATHEYLHNLNGAVLTRGGDINFTDGLGEADFAQFQGQVAGMTTDVTIDADAIGTVGNVTLTAVLAATASYTGQVAGMTTDVTIDADNAGSAGNVTLNPVAGSDATATIDFPTFTDIVLTDTTASPTRNGDFFTVSVNAPAAFPGDQVDVEFSGSAANILCLVRPNDGTNNGGTPVTITTAELVELINTGAVSGKNVTVSGTTAYRTLQTATGGDANDITNGGEADGVLATFSGASAASDIDQLILDWNTANPANTLTLSSGDGSQIPTASITLLGGSDASDIDQLISDWNIANPANTLTLSAGNGSQTPTANIVLSGGEDGAGTLDSDAQIGLNDMTLRDEDIVMEIIDNPAPSDIFQQILSPIAEIPVYYKNGASGDWRRDDATLYPVKQGAARIQYNNPVGPWTQEDIQEGYYTSMWIFATNNQDEPVIAILGQAEHDSLSTAQELDTPQSINLAGIPTVEFKLLYRCIYQSSTSFANAPKAALIDVRDLRAVEDTAFAQVAPNDHGTLSGLEDPDHPSTAINSDGAEKDGGLSEFDTNVGEALTTINRLLGQLRIKPHPTDGNRVVITGANRILNSGTTLIQEIRNLVIDFEGAEIDFSTGQIFKADGFTSLGIDFTPEVIPAGEYINYSITLIPAEVNADNTISTQLIVLPAAGTNAVKADAPKAPFAQGTKLGQVTVQEDGGGIATLDEASISQLGTGGGGSGGTGDANELLERLKNRLNTYGTYDYMTPVIFSSVEEDETDELNTTAEYSVVNSNYDFPLTGDVFQSIQMLDDEFLAEEIELTKVELIHYWNLEAVDEVATYEVSRDGGNEWQTITMNRVGQSDTYLGSHIFTEEAANSYTQTIGGGLAGLEDFTDLNELSRQFTLPSTVVNKTVSANITN